MSRILFSDNGITRTELEFHHGELIVSRSQDVEPILDANARLRGFAQSARNPMRLAASVPIKDYQDWRREWREKHADVWTWQTYLAMRLNSRDYSKFRTEDMRI